MAVYCIECGTGNPDGADFCTRCGASLAPTPLIGELVLPDWLTRAATESPEPAPVLTRSRAVESEDRVTPPLAPIPTGDLPSTIPNWLKGPIQPIAVDHPEESLLTDPTDTRGFITEDDLPAWIRQIAVADAARKTETERKLATPAPDEAVTEAPPTLKRRLLPGELDAVRAAAGPSPDLDAGHQVDPTAPTADAGRAEPPIAEPIAVSPTEATAAGSTRTSGGTLRYALIGAILALVAILILAIIL